MIIESDVMYRTKILNLTNLIINDKNVLGYMMTLLLC